MAQTVGEARAWSGRAVVVDLLRCSTTICALVKSGRKDIRLFSSPQYAKAVWLAEMSCPRQAAVPEALCRGLAEKNCDFFSELELGSFSGKFDNSPHLALFSGDPSRPALLVTGSGTPAIMSLGNARQILAGCFANLPALLDYLKSAPDDTLIVPACLYLDPSHVEDFLCSEAIADGLQGRDTVPEAIGKIHSSGRPLDFIAGRPETGEKDLRIALDAGCLPVVPQITIRRGYAAVTRVSATTALADPPEKCGGEGIHPRKAPGADGSPEGTLTGPG
ncbi:MAG: 2-phosphosulfolactate phosphatase [bacterium]